MNSTERGSRTSDRRRDLRVVGRTEPDRSRAVGDARALQLPLGGKTGAEVEGHDWEGLLTRLGCLEHDRALAAAAHAIGSIVMIAALVWGALVLLEGRAHEDHWEA